MAERDGAQLKLPSLPLYRVRIDGARRRPDESLLSTGIQAARGSLADLLAQARRMQQQPAGLAAAEGRLQVCL